MREELIALILRIAEEQNPTLPRPVEIHKRAEAALYGPGSSLDSSDLVSFIVGLEAAVEDCFGVSVLLADEQAMSQKRSPFLTSGSSSGDPII